jgi:hypothetical protein
MLNIPATSNTPSIVFDTENGVLTISGKSISEDAFEFYQPLLDKIEEYKNKPQLKTTVHLKLVYFNTSSSKFILDLLRQFESLKTISEVAIHWYYERTDDDMLEAGTDYSDIVSLPFLMVAVESLE